MDLLKQIIFLVVGFVLLIKGADFFVDGASKIADKFGIPQIVIGLTIVAFGTSAPEAAISISSAVKGSTGIAIGNVLGSNILNVLVILGVTSCITVLHVQKNTVNIEIPFVILISTILVLLGAINGELGLGSGLILLGFFVVFFVYLIWVAKNGKQGTEEETKEENKKSSPMYLLILITIIGMVGIVWGSDVTVDAATAIAKMFNMPDSLIGLTIIALGTSLPELITSITAGLKGNADIAIGNVVGSNIFNILFVLGVTCVIKEVPYASNFIIDGLVSIAAMIVLFIGCFRKKQLGRTTGIIMLLGYVVYFVYLLMTSL